MLNFALWPENNEGMLNFNLKENRYFRNFTVVSPVGTYSAKKGVWKIKHTNYTPGEYQEEVKYKCQQTSQLAFCFVVIGYLYYKNHAFVLKAPQLVIQIILNEGNFQSTVN